MDGHLLCCLDAVNQKKVKNIIEVYFPSHSTLLENTTYIVSS